MIHILHLSDLHIIQSAQWNNLRACIINEAKTVQYLPKGQKMLILTGDFHNYSDGDYNETMLFLRDLFAAMDIDPAQDVFVVAGNHDIGNQKSMTEYFGEKTDWKLRQVASAEWLQGHYSDHELYDGFLDWRMESYLPFCHFLFESGISSQDDLSFAKPHVRGWRNKLNLFILNTTMVANGKEKQNQMVDLKHATDDALWTNSLKSVPALAIGHNSFFDLHKDHQNGLTAVFKRHNVCAYLCGDTHRIELDRNNKIIRLESDYSVYRDIPNVVCVKGTSNDSDRFSDFGLFWHNWDEHSEQVCLRMLLWKPEVDQTDFILCGKHHYSLTCSRLPSYIPSVDVDKQSHDTPHYQLVPLLAYPNIHFVGRSVELEKIHRQLQRIDNKVFLVGMGGIGKSEIAKMYLKRYSQHYDVVRWVTFDHSLQQTLSNDDLFKISGLSREDYLYMSHQEYAKRKLDILLQIANRKTLIILDNFNTKNDPNLQDFCGGTYAVIFTTQYHQLSDSIQEIEIKPMEQKSELLEVFQADYSRSMSHQEQETVEQIIEFIWGHTMTLRLVAATMQDQRLSPEKMLTILRKSESESNYDDYNRVKQIFDRLKTIFRLSSLNETELSILINLSLLPTKGISVEIFQNWYMLSSFDAINSLVRKSWVQHDSFQDTICLHPIIADIVLPELEKKPNCCTNMLENFFQQAINYIDSNRQIPVEKKQFNAYVSSSIHKRLPKSHPLWYKMLRLKIETESSFPPFSQVIRDCKLLTDQSCSLEHKLYGFNRLSGIYLMLGQFKEALNVASDGYNAAKKLANISLGEAHQRRVLLGRIIKAYNGLKQFNDAANLLDELTLLSNDTYENASVDVAKGWCECIIASVLYNLGKIEKGGNIVRSAIAHYKAADNQWYECFANQIYALFLARKGQFKDALQIIDQTHLMLLPMCGLEHPAIASIWETKARIYVLEGKLEVADKYWKKSIDLYERINAPYKAEYIKELEKSISIGVRILPII